MRANAHADERGARLNDDDRAGIFSLYPASSTPPSTPAAPANLVATAVSSTSIQLTWTDNATNETSYRVQQKEGNGSYKTGANLGANVTTTVISGLKPGTTYSFRVQALNGSTASDFSNVAQVTTPSSAQPPAAPSSLTATPVSTTSIRLDWHDNASTETGFVLQGSSPDGALTLTKNDGTVVFALEMSLKPPSYELIMSKLSEFCVQLKSTAELADTRSRVHDLELLFVRCQWCDERFGQRIGQLFQQKRAA